MTTELIGRWLSWGDMANPRRAGVVVKLGDRPVAVFGANGLEPGGKCFRVVFEDLHISHDVHERTVDAGHAWRWEDRDPLTAEQCAELLTKAEAKQAADRAELDRKREEETRRAHVFAEELATVRPAWAKAAIIAELQKDDCDYQTDYFNSITTRRIVLAWSKHRRDLFPEMRKAAARHPETEHLATADAKAEHREKYSMGRGYFLQAGSTYSGWRVEKYDLGWRGLEGLYPADVAPIRDTAPAPKPTPEPQPEPITDAPALAVTVKENDKLGGVELHFTAKPPEELRERLKAAFWRWSRRSECWYIRRNPETRAFADAIAAEVNSPATVAAT